MTINEAFAHLVSRWKQQPKEFKNKYRQTKSSFTTGNRIVPKGTLEKILIEAGYKVVESWSHDETTAADQGKI
jgi:hypothetical protein